MVLHTQFAGTRSRQPTRHDVGNRLPLAPNVPLSCADVRYNSVKLRTYLNPYCHTRTIGCTPANGNTKSNRSHGGSDGRISPAPSVLIREAGARAIICLEGNNRNRNSYRGWGYRGSQNTSQNSRAIGAAGRGRVEGEEASQNAHTTNLIALSFLTVAIGYVWAAYALLLAP